MIGQKGNPNYAHLEKLLDAEYAALRGRKLIAKKCYQDAVTLAARSGIVHEQAVINERFGDGCGDSSEAQYRFKCAIDLYKEWGALVKVDLVEQKLSSCMDQTEMGPRIGG